MRCLTSLFVFILSVVLSHGQTAEKDKPGKLHEIQAWQNEMNEKFKDPEHSPLKKEAVETFEGLEFFEIDTGFYVVAAIELTPEAKPFKMRTTTSRLADYRQYATATFKLGEQEFSIPVYQNLRLLKMEGYENYLFIPFNDLTNGHESYAGGRYVESEITGEEWIVIDFNKAYNPYCVYSDRYSCPIPPPENFLETEIKAGVKKYGDH